MAWQIHGHDWAVNLLQRHAAGQNLRHAYLLVGPDGVGRRTLALRFAQALNCREAVVPGEYCGICRDCKQMSSMEHPDLSLLTPEEGHRDILIDQVRALQRTLSLAPYTAPYRIALLPNFEHVTEEASNALLKTLEEPSDKVVLLITVGALESLLPTIVSRCQVIRLRPASIKSAQAYLQSTADLPEKQAVLIAHLSGGRIGEAVNLLNDPKALARRQGILRELIDLIPAKRYQRFKLAESLSLPHDKARLKAGEVLPIWLTFWHDVFVKATDAQVPLANIDLLPQIEAIAAILDVESARHLMVAHDKALEQLDAYVNVRLLLETLMIQWPYCEVPIMAP